MRFHLQMQVGPHLGFAPALAPTLEPLAGSGGLSVRAVIDRVAAAGFRHVQLSATMAGLRPRELDKSARRDLLNVLKRSELSLAGIDLWIPPSHFVETQHVDRAVGAFLQAIELASDLGRCPLSVQLPASSDDGGEAAAIVGTMAAHAERFGVPIADHALPIALRENSSIGVGVDPAAMLAMNLEPSDVVLAHGGSITSARLCDLLRSGMRGPIGLAGESRLDASRYKVSLSVAGYLRPVVLDARQWSEPWRQLTVAAEAWRRE